jgi:hypothetical protein
MFLLINFEGRVTFEAQRVRVFELVRGISQQTISVVAEKFGNGKSGPIALRIGPLPSQKQPLRLTNRFDPVFHF